VQTPKSLSRAPLSADVLLLNSEELSTERDALVQVYRCVFTLPPYDESETDAQQFGQSLAKFAQYTGFRCVVARDRTTAGIVGLALGWTSAPGRWWRDILEKDLDRQTAQEWLSDCFEFAELAVIPDFQGRGIGGRLHDCLLADLPHRTSILTTLQEESAALRLYRRRGWVVLRSGYFYSDSTRPSVLMGNDLRQRHTMVPSAA